MRRFEVELNIPADELLRYYRGTAGSVFARDRYGRRLQFPAVVLRPFVTSGGVRGRFVLHVNDANRLERVERA